MVDVNAQLLAEKVQHGDIGVLSAADEKLKMSLLGQQYVADWKYLLAAAGRTYQVSVPEHTTGGGALTGASGNATVDLDQPELVVPCGTGYVLIPLEFEVDAIIDMDAYDDKHEVYLFADRTQTQSGLTGTNVTPQNMLDGGEDYPGGQAVSIVTADLTDPVHSRVLTYRAWELTQVAAETAGGAPATFHHHKVWDAPELDRGPCSHIGIIAGTNAPVFVARYKFGIVPSAWFPTS